MHNNEILRLMLFMKLKMNNKKGGDLIELINSKKAKMLSREFKEQVA